MEKILLFLLTMIMLSGCTDSNELQVEDEANTFNTRSTDNRLEYHYWCDGVKIPLTVNENKFFVLTETEKYENISKSEINAGSKLYHIDTEYSYYSLCVDIPDEKTNLIAFTLHNNSRSSNIRSTEDLVYIAPYFKTSDGSDLGITNVFSVGLETEQDLDKLKKLSAEYNLNMLGRNIYDRSVYYLSCTKNSKGNALEMANLMYESGAFEYASPVFLIDVEPAYIYINDDDFSSQWNLYNRTYPSVDINYKDAIDFYASRLDNVDDVIVAVVDNGVYDHHLDLPLHDVSFDADSRTSPSRLYGGHGTMCAGIIGATTNNDEGIAGIASGVKIMPISIVYGSDAVRLGISPSNSEDFANAIRFAMNNDADVISNSWSYPSPITNIHRAIKDAHSVGRTGKGCVVVFASGNEYGAVSQVAAGVPETLVVGAIDQTGTKAAFSNYGPELDVVAPGVSILTTTWTGSYAPANGTSFACPHASGIAALLLSANPNFTHKQVVDAIEATSRKIGGYSYTATPGRPNGMWNNDVGYGLVDAHAALAYEQSLPEVKCHFSIGNFGLPYFGSFYVAIYKGVKDDHSSNEMVYDTSVTVPYGEYGDLDDGSSSDPGVKLTPGQYTISILPDFGSRYYYYVFHVGTGGSFMVDYEGGDYWFEHGYGE